MNRPRIRRCTRDAARFPRESEACKLHVRIRMNARIHDRLLLGKTIKGGRISYVVKSQVEIVPSWSEIRGKADASCPW